MNLPVRHRPGPLLERPFPAPSRSEPIGAGFGELFERMNRFPEAAGVTPAAGAWSPLTDLQETDDAYAVEAGPPGIEREDIDVEIGERELRITGEYKEREREGVLRRSTRRAGRFGYRARLPTDVEAEEITATSADGVPTATVPKAQEAKRGTSRSPGPEPQQGEVTGRVASAASSYGRQGRHRRHPARSRTAPRQPGRRGRNPSPRNLPQSARLVGVVRTLMLSANVAN